MSPDYECPRCGYHTKYKTHIHKHFYNKHKQCPALKQDIVLTDEVKQYVLDNRIYRSPQVPIMPQPTLASMQAEMKALRTELAFLRNKKTEKFYQTILEDFLQGTHQRLSCGETDITTETFHAEIKHWESWKHAAGQILAYNNADPKDELRVYFFGKYGKKNKEIALNFYKNININVYECVDQSDGVSIIDFETNKEIYSWKLSI